MPRKPTASPSACIRPGAPPQHHRADRHREDRERAVDQAGHARRDVLLGEREERERDGDPQDRHATSRGKSSRCTCCRAAGTSQSARRAEDDAEPRDESGLERVQPDRDQQERRSPDEPDRQEQAQSSGVNAPRCVPAVVVITLRRRPRPGAAFGRFDERLAHFRRVIDAGGGSGYASGWTAQAMISRPSTIRGSRAREERRGVDREDVAVASRRRVGEVRLVEERRALLLGLLQVVAARHEHDDLGVLVADLPPRDDLRRLPFGVEQVDAADGLHHLRHPVTGHERRIRPIQRRTPGSSEGASRSPSRARRASGGGSAISSPRSARSSMEPTASICPMTSSSVCGSSETTFASDTPSSSSARCTWPLGTAQTRHRSCVRITSGCSRRRSSLSRM